MLKCVHETGGKPDHDHGLGLKKEVSRVLRDVIELSFPVSQKGNFYYPDIVRQAQNNIYNFALKTTYMSSSFN